MNTIKPTSEALDAAFLNAGVSRKEIEARRVKEIADDAKRRDAAEAMFPALTAVLKDAGCIHLSPGTLKAVNDAIKLAS